MLNKEAIGKNIATRRKLQGLTQKDLADTLHVSYQAISQWESGKSLPTVEMLYDLAIILDVTIESLLSDVTMVNRDISYMDSGLDVGKLYVVKGKVHDLITKGNNVVRSKFMEPLFFRPDTTGMKNPVYAKATYVPGSKARLAREQGFDKEICMDLAARAINDMCCRGIRSLVFQAHFVGGNMDGDLLYEMARSFKETCESNGVVYGGMAIGSQPVNFRPGEYELSASIMGTCDEENINFENRIKEGDVLIALMTEGIDAVSYPYTKVMLDRKPELRYARIDKEHTFIEELLKPNVVYNRTIEELDTKGMLHDAFRVTNSFVKDAIFWSVPDYLTARIDLDKIMIPPLFHFIEKQNMIGRNFIPHRFAFGVGMIVAVPQEKVEESMEIIRKHHECYVLGAVEKNTDNREEKVRTTGEIHWDK